MFSYNNSSSTLSEPLLGTETNELEGRCVVNEDADLEAMKRPTEEQDEEEIALGSTRDILTSSMILYFLLLIQFALPYYSQYSNDNNGMFSSLPALSITVPSISLFAVATMLYKSSLECSCTDSQHHWTIFLLPEIWMNVVLFVVLWTENITAALELVLMGNLVLATWGLLRSILSTCSATSDVVDDDELGVSLYRGHVRTIGEEEEPVIVVPVLSCCGQTMVC